MTDFIFLKRPTLENAQEILAKNHQDLAGKPLREIASGGTDNVMFQIGDELVLRMPLHEAAANALRKEVAISARTQGLPLAVPEVVAAALEDDAPYAIFKWIEGSDYYTAPPSSLIEAAERLGEFVRALRMLPPDDAFLAGAKNYMRGVPLVETDEPIRKSILAIDDEFDSARLLEIWDDGIAAEGYPTQPVWLHGDLHAGNLITNDRSLTGVIDFGLAGVGDGAADLPPAWWLFDGEARERFRQTIKVDDNEWRRGHGWALHNAAIAYAYYRDKDKPMLTAMSRKAIVRLLRW